MQFGNANINGVEITTNGKKSTELDIDILNGINIPKDGSQMKAFAKSIGLQVKRELKNQNDFDVYKILFETHKSNSAITNSIAYIFKKK